MLIRLAILLLFFFLLKTATADIRSIKFTSFPRRAINFQNFKFTKSGHLSISIESAALGSSSFHNLSRLGFCIIRINHLTSSKYDLFGNFDPDCPLDDNTTFVKTLFDFKHLIPPKNSFNGSYPITSPGDYALYFANCQPPGSGSRITMSVTTEMYNLILNGGKEYKDYLSAGRAIVTPSVYLGLAAAYLVFFVVWVWLGICATNRKTYMWIYLLMSGLLLMKALGFVCTAVDKNYIKLTGTSHGGWGAAVNAFVIIRAIMLCILIMAICFSWGIPKNPCWKMIMIIVLMALAVLQPVYDIGFTRVIETGPLPNISGNLYQRLIFLPPLVRTVVFSLHACINESFSTASACVICVWLFGSIVYPIVSPYLFPKLVVEIFDLLSYAVFFYIFHFGKKVSEDPGRSLEAENLRAVEGVENVVVLNEEDMKRMVVDKIVQIGNDVGVPMTQRERVDWVTITAHWQPRQNRSI